MSKRSKSELIEQVFALVRANQVATDLFDDVVADYLGINRTDHRVIDLIDQQGPITPGRLAELNRLSPAAMTTVLDRLEAKGYARRFPDPDDRRRILVEVTPLVHRRAEAIYGPLGEEAASVASNYTTEQLEAIADFLRRGNEVSAHHLERVIALRDAARGGSRPSRRSAG
jgi:DNA-binding MarR family transcriptional regulator